MPIRASSSRGYSHHHPVPGFDTAGSSVHLQTHGGGYSPGPSTRQFDSELGNHQPCHRYPARQEEVFLSDSQLQGYEDVPSGFQAQSGHELDHPPYPVSQEYIIPSRSQSHSGYEQPHHHYVPPTPRLWSTLQGALGDSSAPEVPPLQDCANDAATAMYSSDAEVHTSIQGPPHLSPASVSGWSTSTATPTQIGEPKMYSRHQSTAFSPSHQTGSVPSVYEHHSRDTAYSHSTATSYSATSAFYPWLSYVGGMDSDFGCLQVDESQRSHSAGTQSPSPCPSSPNQCIDVTDCNFEVLHCGFYGTDFSSGEPSVEVEPEPETTQLAVALQPRDLLKCGWEGCAAVFNMDRQALKAHLKEAHGATSKRSKVQIRCRFLGCTSTVQASSLGRHYEGHMIQYSCECGMTAKLPDHFKDSHLSGNNKKGTETHSLTGKAKLAWVTKVAGLEYRIRRTA